MCNQPNKPASAASAETPMRFAVGDEIEIRMRVVSVRDKCVVCVVVGAEEPAPRNLMLARELAAGRLVSTRPLAVGDSVKTIHGAVERVGRIEHRYRDRGIEMALVRWADDSAGTWRLADLVRAAK